MAENKSLWDRVSTTDAKYTKGFSRGGGFKGTAINATWLVREASKTFGPCGIGWGFTVVDEKYVSGAGPDIVHVVRLRLWYVLDGQRGEVEQYGQTTMVGMNKNGAFTDEEAPKKSITDAMSKCLSLIGFGADIHLGLWDDNKYASDRSRESGKSDGAGKPERIPATDLPATLDDAGYAALCAKYADSIAAIRDGIRDNMLGTAAEAWFELSQEVKTQLWKAPSKGGCFTTQEREVIRSDAFKQAHYGEAK